MEDTYEVAYIQVKLKDLTPEVQAFIQSFSEDGKRPYVQIVSNDAIPIAASSVDLWLTQYIDHVGKENVFLITGKPTPPPCPPTGCSPE